MSGVEKSLSLGKQLLCDSDKSSSWTQGTEILSSQCCCEVSIYSKASMAMVGGFSHTGGCASINSGQRDTPKPWISLHTLTKLQQMFSIGRMPASSTAGWHSNRILFLILPFILSHWEETSREREITGLQQIQEIFRKSDDWKNPNRSLFW